MYACCQILPDSSTDITVVVFYSFKEYGATIFFAGAWDWLKKIGCSLYFWDF